MEFLSLSTGEKQKQNGEKEGWGARREQKDTTHFKICPQIYRQIY